jgi:hypothetical protein
MTYLNRLLARQKIDVRDVDYEQMKKIRREKNVVNAREILRRAGCMWIECHSSHPDGVAFSVYLAMAPYGTLGEPIPYWPEIGKWIDRDYHNHYGCRNLVKYLKGE